MLKDYADFLEKDKTGIVEHLYVSMMTCIDEAIDKMAAPRQRMGLINHIYFSAADLNNPVFTQNSHQALLIYLLAHPIFTAHEIEQFNHVLPHSLPYILSDMAQLLGTRIHTLTLDFDTLRTEHYDFGKIVCFESHLGADEIQFVDKNNKPLKNNVVLFISNTLKIVSANNTRLGKQTLQYLELDL
ncbi:hypothetical protein NHP21005_15670 [Helicobacter sp. NHP21005]|uniref:hypothetical protein n=1 Tax=Helicobacter felistomachi TaxID=3040201 RepID=UPI002573786B|nr:hypothetical protein [Helicobacter sp. NHP21005]BEG57879.1 hypothetical protein NHP21005_15670 [Helicobacter sp. NHP21005]